MVDPPAPVCITMCFDGGLDAGPGADGIQLAMPQNRTDATLRRLHHLQPATVAQAKVQSIYIRQHRQQQAC